MNNMQFNEEQEYARSVMGSEKSSWLSGLVIKTGLAKDNAGAQKVLLVVFVLVVFATGMVLWTN